MKKLRSRIMEIFSKEILKEMYELQTKRLTWGMVRGQRTKVEYSAKMKVQDMTNILTRYLQEKDYSFSFPGAGTNRMTVLIDGFIYKIALDQDGYIDNLNEFILSKEAQPYVTKTYETNGLIAVAEYVTLISYEEFVEKKSKILEILDDISREYLIGDMGWTQKNYANWGYRKNSDDLVILDFGHMHRLSGEKLLCRECCSILQYNSTYTKLKCLNCGKEEEFMTIKLRLSKQEERDNIDENLKKAYQLTEPTRMVEESEIIPEEVYEEESDELISTRFSRFAPKKRKRFEYIPENDVKEEVTEIPYDAYEQVMGEYMKVVTGKVKLRTKHDNVPVVKKPSNDPVRLYIEELNDDELATEYVFNLFIMDKIDEETYNYYLDCIENGFDDEEIESNEIEQEIEQPVNTIDVKNNNVRDDHILEIDDDKVLVFDEEEFEEEYSNPMLSMLKAIKDEDFEDDEDEDEPEIVVEETVSLSVKPATVVEDIEPKVEEEETVGLKIINSSNKKQEEKMEETEEVGLKIISKEESVKVIDVVNNNKEDSVGIKIVNSKSTFSDDEIMLKIQEIQNQRSLEEDDYSEYEEEYAHLYVEEDTMSNKKGSRKNWK